MIRLFETIERKQYILLAGSGLAAIALVWYVTTAAGLVPKLFLPGPQDIIHQLANGPTIQEWAIDLLYSCKRVFAGFIVAAVLAIPLGLYIGTIPRFDAIASPLVEMARYVPVPALLPLCILWFGIGELEKIFVVFLGTFFQLVVSVAAATRTTPRSFVDAARTLGIADQVILWRVVFPAAWPSIFDFLRISMGWAWSYLVVAEIVAAGSGVGYRIMWSQRYLQVGLVFVGIVELALLGLAVDGVFRLLRKHLFQWSL